MRRGPRFFVARGEWKVNGLADRYQTLLDVRARALAERQAIIDAVQAAGRVILTDEEDSRDQMLAEQMTKIDRELAREEDRRAQERAMSAAGNNASVGARITGVHDRVAEKPWTHQGEFYQAIARQALGGGPDPRLTRMSYEAAGLGMHEGTGSDGGFLVGTEVRDAITERIFDGEILSRVTNNPLGENFNSMELTILNETSRVDGSRFGGVRGYWVAEGGTITSSRPLFDRVKLDLEDVAALVYATTQQLKDSVNLESRINRLAPAELRFQVEDAIYRGNGVGKPLGILNSTALVTVAKETGQAASTVVKENIDKMWARGYASLRRNMVWLINQDIEPQLDDLQMVIGTGGVPVYLPPGGISETPFARLKGRPVIPIEYCPTLGTVGDIALVDLSQYEIITQGSIAAASSMHVAFVTNEMAFRFTWRIDGESGWRAPLTPYQGTSTLSPFVVLATRA